jgi:hypothetical protein
MKKRTVVFFAFVFAFTIHGVALGDGGGIPAEVPSPTGNIVGAYVKGFFTIGVDKLNPNQYTHHNIHAVLEWADRRQQTVRGIDKKGPGRIDLNRLRKTVPEKKVVTPIGKEVHLFSAAIEKNGSQNLCSYSADHLKNAYQYLPPQLGVPEAFGIPNAKTYISKFKIINKDSCGDERKAMIQGEVEILLYAELP